MFLSYTSVSCFPRFWTPNGCHWRVNAGIHLLCSSVFNANLSGTRKLQKWEGSFDFWKLPYVFVVHFQFQKVLSTRLILLEIKNQRSTSYKAFVPEGPLDKHTFMSKAITHVELQYTTFNCATPFQNRKYKIKSLLPFGIDSSRWKPNV